MKSTANHNSGGSTRTCTKPISLGFFPSGGVLRFPANPHAVVVITSAALAHICLCHHCTNLRELLHWLWPQNDIGEMRGCFLPSPSCMDFKVYEWLGKVMGAVFRSNESLPLMFPPFIWKKLLGEPISWEVRAGA